MRMIKQKVLFRMLPMLVFCAALISCNSKQESTVTVRAESENQASTEELQIESKTTDSEENIGAAYKRVLNRLDWSREPCYLQDVKEFLAEEELLWEGYYNLSGERVDMLWEDGTKLLFLAAPNDAGEAMGMELMMINESLNDNGFQENYLHQYDVTMDEEYYPQTATRLLDAEELQSMNQTALAIARNELFARHGRKYEDVFLKAVFTRKSWYRPQYDGNQFTTVESQLLNDYEKENLKVIIKAEQERGFRFNTEGNVKGLKGLVSGSWLDFDGDGKKEMVGYDIDFHYSRPAHSDGYELYVNLKEPYFGFVTGDLIDTGDFIYVGSLDGKTIQVFLRGNTQDNIPMIDVYEYRESVLEAIGRVHGKDLEIAEGSFLTYRPAEIPGSPPEKVEYHYKDGEIFLPNQEKILKGSIGLIP